MGRLRASALPRGRQAGSCQRAGLSWSLHTCIRSHPHNSQHGRCSRPASGRRIRGGEGRWLSGAQHRPVGGSGLEPEPVGRRCAPSKAGRNAGRRRACPHPAEARAPTAPSSFTPFPRPPSRHRPHLCRRLWVLLKNRNRLRSHRSSGPAYSVYELRQVTQALWASTSSSVKWGDAPARLVGLP